MGLSIKAVSVLSQMPYYFAALSCTKLLIHYPSEPTSSSKRAAASAIAIGAAISAIA
jgi:hypothetical protein